MPVNVDVKIEKSFKANCSAKKAFDQLANIADTFSLFPKLEKFVELGDGVWRCEMDNIVASGIAHKMKYTSKYSNDGKFRINWEPAPGEGNAKVSGGWTIKDEGSNGCSITLKSGGEFEMPMPKLMKNIAEGIVKSELEAQVAIFAERIKAKLES